MVGARLRPRAGAGLRRGGAGGTSLAGSHERQRNHDVGAAGADGALAVGRAHQFAQRIGQAALDPVPDHHACAERGVRKELLGRRRRQTHQFILAAAPCDAPG